MITNSDLAIVQEINDVINSIIEFDQVGKVTLMLSNGKEISFDIIGQRLRPGCITDDIWEVQEGTGLVCIEVHVGGHLRKKKHYVRASEIVAFEVTAR